MTPNDVDFCLLKIRCPQRPAVMSSPDGSQRNSAAAAAAAVAESVVLLTRLGN